MIGMKEKPGLGLGFFLWRPRWSRIQGGVIARTSMESDIAAATVFRHTSSTPVNEWFLPVLFAIAMLAGCGVETATIAATGAVIKKQELEQAQMTQADVREKLDQAMQKMPQRPENDGDK